MGRIRIIAGELRGRQIDVPDGNVVRPTGDRAREALFSILGSSVAGAAVADVFAGSGALGIEALSRGADRAVFVEADPRVAATLRRNLVRLGLDGRAQVLQDDALQRCRNGFPGGPVSIVFCDPPYGTVSGSGLLAAMAHAGTLEPGGVVILERDRAGDAAPPDPPDVWSLYRQSRYGRNCLDFYRFSGS